MKAIAVTLLLLASSPVLAQAPASPAPAEGAAQAPRSDAPRVANASTDDGHQLCRYVENQSNSRLGRNRVCHTSAEWREIDSASGD